MQKMVAIIAICGVLATGASTARTQQPSSDDKRFLTKDSQGNVAEVELAKLALSKASEPAVKKFARQMIDDHEQLARNSKTLLDRAGIRPSTSLDTEHQRLYNKLKTLSGREFDKEYVTAMEKDHHEDLKAFRKEVGSTNDPAIRSIVQAGEAIIAEHTQMIDEISTKMGMTPAS